MNLTLRNPLYQWTHLELLRYFDICGKLLNGETAAEIYDTCSAMLQTEPFSTRRILQRMSVKVVCTTDDPVDTLEHHHRIAQDQSFTIKVLPAFRPDKAMAVESPAAFNLWVNQIFVFITPLIILELNWIADRVSEVKSGR